MRIASLEKLLSTIFISSVFARAGYFQDTSVCAINSEAVIAVCLVANQCEPVLFICKDKREKCMLMN